MLEYAIKHAIMAEWRKDMKKKIFAFAIMFLVSGFVFQEHSETRKNVR